jgi:16S rRNA (guanine(966)-N(2))-methyltransferase RsmD
LDLFAGTGVMGFEALSRGATQVVLIEKSRPAYQTLVDNKTALKATNAQVINLDALHFLKQNQQVFDVIFVDPPYHQGLIDQALPLIKTALSEDGQVYVEAEFALEDSADWQVYKSGKAGNVFYHLLKASI